jgi:hypothetical protein
MNEKKIIVLFAQTWFGVVFAIMICAGCATYQQLLISFANDLCFGCQYALVLVHRALALLDLEVSSTFISGYIYCIASDLEWLASHIYTQTKTLRHEVVHRHTHTDIH